MIGIVVQKLSEEIIKEIAKIGVTVAVVAFAEVIGQQVAVKLFKEDEDQPAGTHSPATIVLSADEDELPLGESSSVSITLGDKNHDNVFNINIHPRQEVYDEEVDMGGLPFVLMGGASDAEADSDVDECEG